MKKSELKEIIKECINEAKTDKGYVQIGVPFGEQKLAWDDLYDDFDTLTGKIIKTYRGTTQYHRGYEAKGKYWFSYELNDKQMAEDLVLGLSAMAKKISPELERAIRHSKVEVS